MSTSLYQKYRPQRFADMVGQEHIRTTLQNELRDQAVAHAYLFCGPRGTGKTSTARLLARAVNCQQITDGEPCNTCEYCVSILQNRALDVVEIDAASHTGVDHVREHIIENARVAPSRLPWKVFIIDEVHMLSTSAFNALLKTLEEPPKQTIFILATTEIHKVPATIASRCERFTFHTIRPADVVARLTHIAQAEGVEVDPEVLHAITRRCEGALRDAESLLGQVLSLQSSPITLAAARQVLPYSDADELINLFQEIQKKDIAAAITRVNRLYHDGAVLTQFTKDAIEFLRALLLYSVQQDTNVFDYMAVSSEQEVLKTLVMDFGTNDLSRIIHVWMRAAEQLRSASIPQLPIELAIIDSAKEKPLPVRLPATSTLPPSKQTTAPRSTPTSIGKKIASVAPSTIRQQRPTTQATSVQPDKPRLPITLSIEAVEAQWSAVLEEMKHHNHGLHVTLQVGQIVAAEGNTVTLGFEYQFYQDRLRDARNIPVIGTVFEKIFGGPVMVEVIIGKEYGKKADNPVTNIEQPSEEEVANVWDLASTAFGQPKAQAE
ncbi:MAG: DNA polymerase III subunit gamma/tau [Candidatus Kerfeldbacteria bacterium]|nr:DNA polymerase III subunit gamma/tau [Candidatus Kerfeldbacteria bacterium]